MSEAEDKVAIHEFISHRGISDTLLALDSRLTVLESTPVVDLSEVYARVAELESRMVAAVTEVVEEALEAEAAAEEEGETEEEEEEEEELAREDLEPESSHILTRRLFGARK